MGWKRVAKSNTFDCTNKTVDQIFNVCTVVNSEI